jgi:Holliday junction DNA helicase RuvA
VGPKLGITALSGIPATDLVHAIRRGDVDRLVRIPGIGKKTAERLVLELREKLPPMAGEEPSVETPPFSAIEQDVLSALLNLGCARPAAESAVRKAKATAPPEFEPLFRKALELVR